jgi:hypothetical protein
MSHRRLDEHIENDSRLKIIVFDNDTWSYLSYKLSHSSVLIDVKCYRIYVFYSNRSSNGR